MSILCISYSFTHNFDFKNLAGKLTIWICVQQKKKIKLISWPDFKLDEKCCSENIVTSAWYGICTASTLLSSPPTQAITLMLHRVEVAWA